MHSHTREITLGLSFLLGALHALEPGHGKSAMLVYLVGGKKNHWHPIVMGLSTALAHTFSILVIALVVHWANHWFTGDLRHEQAVSAALQWASSILVASVGGYMLVRTWTRAGDKCCSNQRACDHRAGAIAAHPIRTNGGAAEVEGEGRQAIPSSQTAAHRLGIRTTALLGLAVGLLPCPTALAAYFTGLSSGSPALAYSIVLLFGAGIACSLSMVGILIQHFGESLETSTLAVSRWPWTQIRAGLILTIGLASMVNLAVA